MNFNIKCIVLVIVLLAGYSRLQAQSEEGYSLQQLIDAAMENNRVMKIKDYQVQEKVSKRREDAVKRYPTAMLEGSYRYNFNLPNLTIPAGVVGVVGSSDGPPQLLPTEDRQLTLGDRNNYGLSLTLYQPLTQQAKIGTGLQIDEIDIKVTEKEKVQLKLDIQTGVSKLYYGILIVQKQMEEAEANLELAKAKLYDAEGALAAGKTIEVNLAGLQAGIADEEREILSLQIRMDDLLNDLSSLAQVGVADLKLQPVEMEIESLQSMEAYENEASSNPGLQIAKLNKEKAVLGIRAAEQSNLPDLGLVAGYYYQQGNPLLPTSSPFVGVSLKWNIQDLFSNAQLKSQRRFQMKQAEENVAYKQEELSKDIQKAWRKASQSEALVTVARKVAGYRREEYKIQQDKQSAGLGANTGLLEVRSQLAKAEADQYAAELSYLLAVIELNNLTEK